MNNTNTVKESRLRTWCITIVCVLLPLNVAAQDHQGNYTYAKRYNAVGDLLGEIQPEPNSSGQGYPAVRYTYNAHGALTKEEYGRLSSWQDADTAPENWNGFTVSHETLYDRSAQGWKLRERQRAQGTFYSATEYTYDGYGRVVCQAVRMNPSLFGGSPGNACALNSSAGFGPDRISQFEYNGRDQLLVHRKALGTAIEQEYAVYTYDDDGHQTSVTDANGNYSRMTYDALGRLEYWYFPHKTSTGTASTTDFERYEYDLNDNRTRLHKRDDSTVIDYDYDALNRAYRKATPDYTIYYGYDLQDRERYARFSTPSGEGVTYEYTGFGEVASETVDLGGQSRTVQSVYDAHGNRTALIHPDGKRFNYHYDNLDRLVTVSEQGGATLAQHRYDNDSRLDRITLSNGAVTALEYDLGTRLEALDFQFSGTADDLTLEYAYNPASQLVQHALSNNQYHHQGGWGIQGSYSVNGLNQYTDAGGDTVAHDDNGNLIQLGGTTYTYDPENRLTEVDGTTRLSYDPKGRLHQISMNGDTTTFLYDGDALIAEYDGGLNRRYVHSTRVDTPLVAYHGSGVNNSSRRFLHRNHQGSIIAISNNSANVTTVNTYDAYGNPGSSNEGRFGYTGQMWLPELGLYHYRARVYAPEIGRFLQTDPIGYEDQMNLYAYVSNDPLNFVDPMGMTTEEIVVTGTRGCGCSMFRDAWMDLVMRGPGAVRESIQSSVRNRVLAARLGAALISEMFSEGKPLEGETPDDRPEDFEDLGPSVGHKSKPRKKRSDGSIWERDRDGHGGSKWKRWENKRDWERKKGRSSVRPDGSLVNGPGDG